MNTLLLKLWSIFGFVYSDIFCLQEKSDFWEKYTGSILKNCKFFFSNFLNENVQEFSSYYIWVKYVLIECPTVSQKIEKLTLYLFTPFLQYSLGSVIMSQIYPICTPPPIWVKIITIMSMSHEEGTAPSLLVTYQ